MRRSLRGRVVIYGEGPVISQPQQAIADQSGEAEVMPTRPAKRVRVGTAFSQRDSTPSATQPVYPLAIRSQVDQRDEPGPHLRWDEIVQVVVGSDEESFIAHRKLLLDIPFFGRCLRNGMREAESGQVKLPEDEPKAFSEVLHFMYFQRLSFDICALHAKAAQSAVLNPDDKKPALTKKSSLLVKVYILGKKLGMEALQNATVDALRNSAQYTRFGSCQLNLVESGTEDNDPMRWMLLYSKARDIKHDGWKKWRRGPTYRYWLQENPEAGEMIAETLAGYEDQGPTYQDGFHCHWHSHIDTPACDRQKK